MIFVFFCTFSHFMLYYLFFILNSLVIIDKVRLSPTSSSSQILIFFLNEDGRDIKISTLINLKLYYKSFFLHLSSIIRNFIK